MTSVDESPLPAAAPAETGWVARAARPAEIVLGVVFLASAGLKLVDIDLFLFILAQFGVILLFFQAAIALAVLMVEVFLGIMLLWGPRRRRALLSLTGLVLAGFTGAVVYGWVRYGIDDCGCMGGTVPMPPAVSLAKNLVLFGLVAVAWTGFRQAGRLRPAPMGWKRRILSLYRPFLALVAAVAVAYGAVFLIDPVQWKVLGDRPFARFVFTDDGGATHDLGQGEYLVAFLGARCRHCVESVEGLNYFDAREATPHVVGLCSGSPEEVDRFKAKAKPLFPLHRIEPEVFYQYIGVGYPRFVLVRDGDIVQVWDGRLPTGKALDAASTGLAR